MEGLLRNSIDALIVGACDSAKKSNSLQRDNFCTENMPPLSGPSLLSRERKSNQVLSVTSPLDPISRTTIPPLGSLESEVRQIENPSAEPSSTLARFLHVANALT